VLVDDLVEGNDPADRAGVDQVHPLLIGVTGVQQERVRTRLVEGPSVECAVSALEPVGGGVADVVDEVLLGFQHEAQLVDGQIRVGANVEGQVLAVAIHLVYEVAFLVHPRVVDGNGDRDVAVGGLAVQAVLKSGLCQFARADGHALADPGLFERVGGFRLDEVVGRRGVRRGACGRARVRVAASELLGRLFVRGRHRLGGTIRDANGCEIIDHERQLLDGRRFGRGVDRQPPLRDVFADDTIWHVEIRGQARGQRPVVQARPVQIDVLLDRTALV